MLHSAERSRAVWLLPTRSFQRAQLAVRGTAAGHAELYLRLGEVIEREAGQHDVPVVAVDGSMGVAQTTRLVERLFADALAAGPRARTRSRRQALLRELNQAVVAQVRGYYARPWADGDPDAVIRDFVCECGDPACDLDARLPVGQVAAAPALAPDHRDLPTNERQA